MTLQSSGQCLIHHPKCWPLTPKTSLIWQVWMLSDALWRFLTRFDAFRCDLTLSDAIWRFPTFSDAFWRVLTFSDAFRRNFTIYFPKCYVELTKCEIVFSKCKVEFWKCKIATFDVIWSNPTQSDGFLQKNFYCYNNGEWKYKNQFATWICRNLLDGAHKIKNSFATTALWRGGEFQNMSKNVLAANSFSMYVLSLYLVWDSFNLKLGIARPKGPLVLSGL